jgi:TetR/AcrR family transcriptional regulator
MSIAEMKGREREQRRAYIVGAAEKMFFERGFENVSMSDIAGGLDMNKATLYLYFKNKDSLYFAVLLKGLRIMGDSFEAAVKGKSTGMDRLKTMCRAFFDFCRENPQYYNELCYARTRRFDMAQVEGAMEMMAIADVLIGGIRETIITGVSDGTMRPGLEPMETAVFVMKACESAVRPGVEMAWALEQANISPEQYLKNSIGLMLYALAGE